MNDNLFNLLAENSYRLHKIVEHATHLNAGSEFTLNHEEKEGFLSNMKAAIEENAALIEKLK